MSRVILVRGARQLITMHGPSGPRRGQALSNLGLIEDGSLLVIDGLITNVGPTRRIENLAEARNAEEINASGRVVMPGFVDCHSHLVGPPAKFNDYRLPRTSAEDTAQTGLSLEVDSAVQFVRSTAGKMLELQARRSLDSMLRHGTTTLEIKTGYGMNEAAELKMLRVMASLDDSIHVIPSYWALGPYAPEFQADAEAYVSWICSGLMPKLRQKGLIRFVDLSVSSSGFSVEQARTILQRARSLGLVPKLQADLTERSGAMKLAIEMEAVSVNGLNHLDRTDIEAVARSQTIATLLPGTVHQGSLSRFAPARELIDAGAVVALGSGYSPGTCSTMSMQMVISLACTHMQMTPEEAISASTVNAAYAVLEQDQCATLAFGKRADVIMLNVADYRDLAFHFGGNLVGMCMRAGKVIYKEGAVE